MRADIHRFRFKPEEPVRNSPIPFWQLADCTGRVSASGRYKPDEDTTITWSGGTALRSMDPLSSDISGQIIFGGVASLVTGRFDNFTPLVNGTFTETTTTNGKSLSQQLNASLEGFFFPPLPLSMNLTTYEMIGKSVPSPFVVTENGVSGVLKWPTITPAAAPTLDTQR
ncbi:MAG: hypothetical protein ACI9R3_005414 [Verrucomicrobiales bacterium]